MITDRAAIAPLNALYLLCAISAVFSALIVGIQPLYLERVLDIPMVAAGEINASVQVVVELTGLLLIYFMGYLSDRYGRSPVIVLGFLIAGVGALVMPFSLQIGAVFGVAGLAIFFFSRILMSFGSAGFTSQMWALAGDKSTLENRPTLIAKAAFMMVFGGTVLYALLMQLPRYGGFFLILILPFLLTLLGVLVARRHLEDSAPKLGDAGIPVQRIFKLVMNEPKMHLSFAAAFYARSDMVFISLFLMMWSLHQADLIGMTRESAAAHAGILIALNGVILMLAGPFWVHVMRVYGRIAAIGLGLVSSGLGFASLLLISDPFGSAIVYSVMVIAFGQAGCMISTQVLTLDLTPSDIRGTMMGFFSMVGAAGMIFLVQSGGFYFDMIGPRAPFVLIATGNMLIAGFAYWLWRAERYGHSLETADKTGFKPLLFIFCLLPFIWLLGRIIVTGIHPEAGLNGFPVGYQQRYLGDWALNFLIISLAISPLKDLTGIKKLARYSRMLGLFAFFYVILHVLNYVWLEWYFSWGNILHDLLNQNFLFFGLLAFLLLIPLAISSSNDIMKKIGGKNWKALHRLAYPINLLAATHFLLASEFSSVEPFLYLVVILLLLSYRFKKSKTVKAGEGLRHLLERWFEEIRPLLAGELPKARVSKAKRNKS
ncbi:MAG: magnetosome biogenesis transporter MamZ [Mariprofundus sp.]|nr:magnetosome biogenesis transporter MamZ [Mariprofundus sp.]